MLIILLNIIVIAWGIIEIFKLSSDNDVLEDKLNFYKEIYYDCMKCKNDESSRME